MAEAPKNWVVMGVSGVGKSTVARALTQATGRRFLEADDFHPRENILAMQSGRPLDDSMRWPWLKAVSDVARGSSSEVVISCSALKPAYRAFLSERIASLGFIYLTADPEVIRDRLINRTGHFMPASLLESQLADLVPPTPPEVTLTLDATNPTPEIVQQVLAHWSDPQEPLSPRPHS